MNPNAINLCKGCVHASYCALTHNQSAVFSCSDFEELQHQEPTPQTKIINRKPELVS